MKKILGLVLCFVGLSLMGQPAPVFKVDPIGGSISPAKTTSGYLMTHDDRSVLAASVEWQRTNTVTAYAANDCVSTNETTDIKCYPFSFSNVVPESGGGIVLKVRLSSNCTGTNLPASKLWLFSTTNIFLQNDNASMVLKWTNNAVRLGYISIPAATTPTGADANSGLQSAMNSDARLAFNIGSSVLTNRNLYGYLALDSAYTPQAGEKFELKIVVLGQ